MEIRSSTDIKHFIPVSLIKISRPRSDFFCYTQTKRKDRIIELSKHFTMRGGCPNDPGRKKETLNFTLVDYIDVTEEELGRVGHEPGAKCRCQACLRLKNVEDKWILKMGTFYGPWGLNERDEIQSKTRFTWIKN